VPNSIIPANRFRFAEGEEASDLERERCSLIGFHFEDPKMDEKGSAGQKMA
jgi:hypothetical protein